MNNARKTREAQARRHSFFARFVIECGCTLLWQCLRTHVDRYNTNVSISTHIILKSSFNDLERFIEGVKEKERWERG